MYSFWPPHVAKQKQDDQLEHTYSNCVRIQDVALKTSQRRWTIGRSGERGSGMMMMMMKQYRNTSFLYPVMANGIRRGDPRGFNKGRSSNLSDAYRVRQTPEEGRRTYRPKLSGNNNTEEYNSPKTLFDFWLSALSIIHFGIKLLSQVFGRLLCYIIRLGFVIITRYQ